MGLDEIREVAQAVLERADSTADQRVVTLAEAILALVDDLERHQLVRRDRAFAPEASGRDGEGSTDQGWG